MPSLSTLFTENKYNLMCCVIFLILAEVIPLPYQSPLNYREVRLAAPEQNSSITRSWQLQASLWASC